MAHATQLMRLPLEPRARTFMHSGIVAGQPLPPPKVGLSALSGVTWGQGQILSAGAPSYHTAPHGLVCTKGWARGYRQTTVHAFGRPLPSWLTILCATLQLGPTGLPRPHSACFIVMCSHAPHNDMHSHCISMQIPYDGDLAFLCKFRPY